MNSRERVLAAINHEPLDRVPTDIWATGEVWEKLRQHFGADGDLWRSSLYSALDIDGIIRMGPEYVGPPLPEMPEGETVNYWGMRYRPMDYGAGVYMEQYFDPLAEAKTIDDVEQYQWPSADWFDYDELVPRMKATREKHVVMAGYMAPFYHHNLLRGLAQSLMDPHDDAELTHHIIKRISDFFYEHHLRMFETCEGLIDAAEVTDDLGSQTAPLISPETFRTFYRPQMQRFIDLCHSFDIKVFHHDDGAIRPLLPDLVEMGIDILNPIQTQCPGMEMEGLKRDFGQDICFHGAIDNQAVLPFGSPEEVRAEVRHAIDALASDGTGYILAPCHNIQAVTSVESIIAMYDEAHNYGEF